MANRKSSWAWLTRPPWFGTCLALELPVLPCSSPSPSLSLTELGCFSEWTYSSPVLPHTIVYAGQVAHRVLMHPIPSPPPPEPPPPRCSDTCLWAALPKFPPSRSWGLSPAPLALATVLQLLMPVSVLFVGADPCFIHQFWFYSSGLFPKTAGAFWGIVEWMSDWINGFTVAYPIIHCHLSFTYCPCGPGMFAGNDPFCRFPLKYCQGLDHSSKLCIMK